MQKMERYSRQILFKEIGQSGQEKIMNSSAAIVGMGALGTVIANHLVRAGVGRVRIIDRDLVELSNLQRQTLYDEEDARKGLPKVIAAEKKLNKINSEIIVEPIIADLTLENAEDLLAGFDVIVDGTDNFMTRYLLNDVAVKLGIPWVYGGAVSSRGMFAVIRPGATPCYRCLFPVVPAGMGETCDSIGVISPITEIIGSFEALEAMKLLVGAESNPYLEQLDIWYNSSMQMDLSEGRNEECPTCVHHQYEFLDRSSDRQIRYLSLCGRNTVQIHPRQKGEIDLGTLSHKLERIGKVKVNSFLIQFIPDGEISMAIFRDGRVLVHGTNDLMKAKTYYSRFIGS